jgi:CRISPR system Cascade subunit CasC
MKFVSFHALVPFQGVNLNYGEDGLPKEMPLGGVSRTYISSQSQKRRERKMLADSGLPLTIPSRLGFDRFIRHPLEEQGVPVEEAMAIARTLSELATGKDPDKKAEQRAWDAVRKTATIQSKIERVLKSLNDARGKLDQATTDRQRASAENSVNRYQLNLTKMEAELAAIQEEATLVTTREILRITKVEMDALLQVAFDAHKRLREESGKGSLDSLAAKATKAAYKDLLRSLPDDKSEARSIRWGYGLDSALFGRMGTGDVISRVDGALHVAHAFTIHAAEVVPDCFVAVDELMQSYNPNNHGSGMMGETHLSSNVFSYFRVLDIEQARKNLSGFFDNDTSLVETLRQEVQRNIYALACPPLGAKAGSTAPYSRALWVMVEMGDSQPCQLGAFRRPVDFEPDVVANGFSAASRWYQDLLENHNINTERAMMVMGPKEHMTIPGERLSINQLAAWAAERIS